MKMKVEVIGRIGNDAEKIKNKNGGFFVSFPMAITESWTKDGQKQEKTVWIKCQKSVNEESRLHEYLKRGALVSCDGKPSANGYTKKNGDVSAELIVNVRDIVFLASANKPAEPIAKTKPKDDLPF